MTQRKRIILVTIIVLLVLSAAGILWYQLKSEGGDDSANAEHKLPAIKLILTNGCGFEGVAKEFSDFLADKNVDIVFMGNARPIYDKTLIVNRKGDAVDLQRLQRMTGIERFTEARNENALAEFEIIIGKDYETYTKN